MVKKVFCIILIFLIFILCCSEEDKVVPPPNCGTTDTLTFLGLRGKYALDLEYEEPYLYVCAGREGVWKKNIFLNSDWQYLGLADTSSGINAGRGALNLDVNNNHILVAYNGSDDTCRPDQCVGIWGCTDAGANWFRSDSGIPESIVDTFEYNHINDLQRSPFNQNNVFAIYGLGRYVSTNNGNSWVLYGLRGLTFSGTDNIRWNPFKEDELWVFGIDGFLNPWLAVSRNGGISIEYGVNFPSLGFPQGVVSDIAFDKESSLITYVIISSTLIKSTDGGVSWITSGFNIPGQGFVRSIIEDRNRAGVIYLGGSNEVFYSMDGASSIFLLTQLPYETVLTLELDEIKNKLFVGTNDGVYSYNLDTIN